MRKTLFLVLTFLVIGNTIFLLQRGRVDDLPMQVEREKGEKQPNDWFFRQRAYPIGEIPMDQRLASIGEAQALQRTARVLGTWTEAGPTNIPGRITDMAVHPSNLTTIYAGAAAGGVFKSIDGGLTWTPIFDDQGSPSIGALAIHPTDPNILYVGTGEANSSGDSYPGTGIYKTTDGGLTWTHLGLNQSFHIGRIVIDPVSPETVYVAALGKLFGTNADRGVYKSTDGGATWTRVLFVSDSTSAVDVAINPSNPAILYAAMWERIRSPERRKVGGFTSGIYKTSDGGLNWTLLTNGLPPSASDVGRIGLAVAASSPNIVYAIYANHPGFFMGVYKTVDNGTSWLQVNDGALSMLYSSFGWYFGNIRVDPTDPNRVFAMGVPLYRSTNGGNSWSEVAQLVHVDHHAMVIPISDPSRVYLGNDGGVYLSTTGGSSWTRSLNMPSTQFYAINIDRTNPQRLYGGTQDNGTMRTLTGALNDWERIFGGDGFYCSIDYNNPNILYVEYQWGNLYKSTTGGSSWNSAMNGINGSDRTNWSTPVVMDPNSPNILYYGSYRLYRTTNGANLWTAISSDLTNGTGSGNLTYGTITTIAPSASDSQVVYAGTDDGNVWVTWDLGTTWDNISAGLPNRWVTRVAVDPNDPAIAYVTHSGYKVDSYLPHIHRTTNFGITWQDISGNLPQAPLTVVVVDPDQDSTLYVGTDVGVYVTLNLGQSWSPLGIGLPIPVIHDLVLHQGTRSLVAGTHGRSMFRYDLISHDGAVLTLDAPGDTVFTDSTVTPLATVHNFGNVPETFDVTVTIDGYADTVQVTGLGPDSSIQVTFKDWQIPSMDSTTYTMTVCTEVSQDRDTTNDCAQKSIFAYGVVHDGGVITLDAPGDTVFTDSTVTPLATVRNFGNVPETFDVVAAIDGYSDTVSISDLAAGADTQLTFAPWTVPAIDSTLYAMTVCTYVVGDADTSNDCAQKSIFAYTPVGVQEESDLGLQIAEFGLYQNQPNPFYRSTVIRYQIPLTPSNKGGMRGIPIRLAIYDMTGSLVETLVDEPQGPGVYQIRWEGKGAASGVYFYRLSAGDFIATKKLILLR